MQNLWAPWEKIDVIFDIYKFYWCVKLIGVFLIIFYSDEKNKRTKSIFLENLLRFWSIHSFYNAFFIHVFFNRYYYEKKLLSCYNQRTIALEALIRKNIRSSWHFRTGYQWSLQKTCFKSVHMHICDNK